MKYMIMMFGSAAGMMEVKSMDWIKDMIQFMKKLDQDFRESGELVFEAGLVDGSQAKAVTFENGAPFVTDGPYAEAKESIIGNWVVDVENEARALAIASHIVAFTQGPIEVRQLGEAPPDF